MAALGRDAELRELQVIVSEPGAAAQDVHSDSNWGTERLVTMFIALHDVLDERMGPTRFWPNTHAPRCFPPSCRGSRRRSYWPRIEIRNVVRAPCGRRGAHGRLHVAPRRRQHVGDPTDTARRVVRRLGPRRRCGTRASTRRLCRITKPNL